MMGLMVEPLLAEQAETGLRRDFGAWMASEQRRVYALCQHFLQDRDDADCATQDVFLKAYQAIQREGAKELDDPARWLTRIAVNTCLDRLRSRKWQIWRRRPSPEDETAILSMTRSREPESDAQCFANEIRSRLASAVGRLSARQRAVFTLRHYDQMSLEEIAGVLGLDVGTVKAHMFRAISKLREDLKDLYGSRL
jgi:RNA polymerase sigma-70 factor (ECF subfamily)